ncbi:sterol carrier protein domain-containing protein, partial [Bacillus pseudomycoides]
SMVYYVKGKTCVHEPVAFLLEDSEIKQTIAPYYMGRIVDVVGFLKQYPFKHVKNEKLILHIDDPMLEWNKGTFSLKWDYDKQLHITYEKEPNNMEGMSLTIQTLTTMLLSYKSPAFLYDIGRIKGSHEMIEVLENLIPDSPPCFFDYF